MTYLEQIKSDIREYIEDNYTIEEIVEAMQDRDDFEEKLDEELWIDDNVTGNGSGSYTFSSAKAKECVLEDIDTVLEAVREFCCGMDAAELLQKLFNEEWEYFDVTARCYLLRQGISEVLDEIGDTIPASDEPSDDIEEYLPA